jgi:hypothetical protein
LIVDLKMLSLFEIGPMFKGSKPGEQEYCNWWVVMPVKKRDYLG